jgi:hypothetical protein
MDSNLRQRLASAAATDPMARDALKELQWLEARPFEEFQAYWHSRLHDYAPPGWRHQADNHPLLKEAADYERQLITRTFAELEALAWHRGYVDSAVQIEMDHPEVLTRAKQQYLLGELQGAYMRGEFEGRRFLLVRAGIADTMREIERGVEEQAVYTAMLQKLNATVQ